MQYDKKIKIVYLSPLPPPEGGIAKWTKTLFKYGLPSPFEIQIIDTRVNKERKIFNATKINITEIKRNLRIISQFIKKVVICHPHIVHICCSLSSYGVIRDYLCAKASKMLKVKTILHYRGNIIDFSRTALCGISYKILTKLIKLSDVNIALNQQSFNFINNISKKNNQNYLLPNFIDDNVFDEPSVKIPKNKNKIRAIYVGGITYQKGVYEIVKIAPSFQNIVFVLIGSIADDFYPLLKKLPKNVHILKPMSNNKILEELKKSDFFIFLSHTEGFPNAVLEAMASRMPIIATNVGSVPEMIDDGKSGFTCHPKNIDKIKEAIDKLVLYNNFELLGNYNFMKAKKCYSYSVVINKLCDIYNNALS